ncbi:AAA family ATPase [Holdemanella biformis]|uniref:AAA family ATPase n=1 Tax=Holdemanella biformis TaxID=1735 RepID=UPI003078C6F7
MLIQVNVQNFKSFNELNSLNLIASNKLRKQKERLYESDTISLLKSTVIYGSNASGKSNFVEVLRFMKKCVMNQEIPIESYNWYCRNHEDNKEKISSFSVQLLLNEDCYEYGFDAILNTQTIKDEWIVDLNKKKILYQRNNDGKPLNGLNLGREDRMRMEIYLDDFLHNDKSLFLTEMNRNKSFDKDSELSVYHRIYNWFVKDLNVVLPDMPLTKFSYYYDESTLSNIKKIVRSFDTGIEDIEIKNMSEEQLQNKIGISLYKDVINELKKNVQKQGQELNLSMRSKKEFFNITMNDNYDLEIKTLCFKHGQSMLDFEFCEESDGTKRVFDFLDILLNKNQNSVYVIDEMERSLHPNLFNRFIELLNEYQKQSNIQVIFTTHESSIMKQDLFRRDQIWFIERNKDNDSRIYSLDTFNERFDKKISKAYLDGRYGAIPQFKSLHINELE